jgi:acyl phosphate:glycerol-3-phosphate acyltransferase
MLIDMLFAWILSYLVGAIPFGLLVVWVASGKDIRNIESGRTGGTNAMRAAGLIAGVLTAILDVMKGVSTLWIVSWLAPNSTPWVLVIATVLAVIGHNYSIFLIEKRTGGKLQLRGGAGGATALGGAIAIWPQSALIIFPVALVVFLFVGYASVTTITISLAAMIIFAIRAYLGLMSPIYVVYGLVTSFLVLWALRPNLKRLWAGTERLTGLRAYWKKKAAIKNPSPIRKGQLS